MPSPKKVETYATNILGNVLVTIQTGAEGKLVRNLYVEAVTTSPMNTIWPSLVDRENKSVLIMASTEGGMDIEHVAETTPEKFTKSRSTPTGLLGYQKRDLGLALGLSGQRTRPLQGTHLHVHHVRLKRLQHVGDQPTRTHG